ncbi:hypothetical protein SGUI_1255 [Serinicoccus hydrothermalis]|uniref:AtpZ/AtpI family protein n=1 Tax=Serinicoccus hydrothermalis TaxID=1758689 RepID=A0A1B1NB54_9MICO|nr:MULTISPECIES: hypothetical protein [Serinicoccus]ANS78651.1 hypothetical protein SGUI_1255 [Serinicoccus hydrothermalis]
MRYSLFGHTPKRDDGLPPRDDRDEGGQSPETSMGTSVISYLLAGPILFGGIALLVGRWIGQDWVVAVGILAGMALSIYIIWVRYGTQ